MRLLVITYVLLLLPLFGAAQDQKDWTVEPELDLKALGRYYTKAHANTDQHQVELQAVPGFTLAYKDWFSVESRLRLIGNLEDDTRTRIWLIEAFVSLRKKGWSAQLGKQTIDWGNLPGYSALDFANRYDYYDFLDTDDELLGQWGATLRWATNKSALQLRVLAPDNDSRLYFFNNRWIDLPNRILHPAAPGQVLALQQEGIDPLSGSNRPQLGLTFSTEVGRFNPSLAAYWGTNDIPRSYLRFTNMAETSASYRLQLQYHDLFIGVFQLGTYLGDWAINLEGAYLNNQRWVDNALADDNYGFASLTLDRMFFFENPEQQLRLVAQYLQAIGTGDVTYAATELDHVFQSAAIVDLDFRLNYDWHFALRAVGEFAKSGYYLSPSVRYSPGSDWSIALASDWLLGDEQSFFGHYQHNSRLQLTLNRQF